MKIDRILFNANIYTQDANRPYARALAIFGEKIVALGDDDTIRQMASTGTQLDNAGGKTIISGLTDAHAHWEGYTRTLHAVNLQEVPSKAEALERVAERSRHTTPGEWIYGRGWSQSMWENGAFPTAADLDSFTPDHPVYLSARSGHAAWVNSRALQLARIDASTADPTGGSIMRLADGSPSGILFEAPAMEKVAALIPKQTPEQLAAQMLTAQEKVLRLGLTGMHDFDNPSCLRALQLLREQGKLHLRFLKQINVEWIEHAIELGIRSYFGDDWLRFGGLKIFADGALGAKTALMIAPYEDDPTNYGISVTDKEETYRLISKASANGLHSTVHAIGDRAVHDVLDVYEAVRNEEATRGISRDRLRHRIEHVQIIHPSDVNRLANLNVIASMQPIHATADYLMADRYWGKRAAWSYAWRKQLTAGAVLAFGSDAPVEDINPFAGIHAAATRQRADGSPVPEGWYPEEKLTVQESLYAYTQGAAFAAHMETRLGKLAPGYLADMILLDRDITAVPPDELLQIEVQGTMVGGEWRFRNFD